MFDIKIDSRKVNKGDTFVAIKGNNHDGHDFIKDAINNGATKVICEYGDYEVETILVSNPLEYITNYLTNTYKNILEEIDFIGLTGTNGKTTTSFLVYQHLNKLNIKTAYIGTIGFYLDKFVKNLDNTTPNIVELYELIIESYEKGYRKIVMEVSSHALDLNRVDGINFDIVGFTNLTQDHLDYHKTFDNYLNAKLKILEKTDNIIVNIDDDYSDYFTQKNYQTYGFKDSDFKIISYEEIENKTSIAFLHKDRYYESEINLLGKFNVSNYILSLALCSKYVSIEEIINISKEIYPPKGRCEIVNFNDFNVVIDYAHTPDAVKKIIETFKNTSNKRVLTLIGCGGNRDKSKRPIMGSIATLYSDYVIFTSDNPRCEDENIILKDITDNLEKTNYEIIVDRKSAIKKIISLGKNKDTILILGKGHEDYQIIGTKKIHFSDMEEVIKIKNNIDTK